MTSEGTDTKSRIQDVEARVAALRARVASQDRGLQKFLTMFGQYFEIHEGNLSDHERRLNFKEKEVPGLNAFAERVRERCGLSNASHHRLERMVEESARYLKERIAHLETVAPVSKKDG